MALTSEEIDACREAFMSFDMDGSGHIDVNEIRRVLEAMNQKPSEEEIFLMLAEVDSDMSGEIDFGEFLRVIERQKLAAREQVDDDSDLVDAFVACGGNSDKSGVVERSTLVKIIKVDFGLTIDIEELIDNVDKDGSGEVEFNEFKELLTKSQPSS